MLSENKLNFEVLDLAKEYRGSLPYTDSVKYAVVSSLTEEELSAIEELQNFKPFIVISPEVYEAILDSHKESERARIAEIAHPSVPLELAETIFIDELDAPPIICESGIALEFVVNAMMSLPDRQGSRIYKRYILGYTSKEISTLENVALVSVFESLRDAKEAMRDVFAELGLGGNEHG
ncbi:MAG: hypothetical protein J5504_02650 [Butyrivibrio sp.]|nr:hypothetical protein [Butyrivibrio sp.]